MTQPCRYQPYQPTPWGMEGRNAFSGKYLHTYTYMYIHTHTYTHKGTHTPAHAHAQIRLHHQAQVNNFQVVTFHAIKIKISESFS